VYGLLDVATTVVLEGVGVDEDDAINPGLGDLVEM
jgi:hypothetical protein